MLIRSESCFINFFKFSSQDLVVKDTYVPPHAALELGIVYAEMGKYEQAREWLEKAKNYRGFLVEVLVHLRIHAAQREICDREKIISDERSNDVEESVDEIPKSIPSKSSAFGTWIKSFV